MNPLKIVIDMELLLVSICFFVTETKNKRTLWIAIHSLLRLQIVSTFQIEKSLLVFHSSNAIFMVNVSMNSINSFYKVKHFTVCGQVLATHTVSTCPNSFIFALATNNFHSDRIIKHINEMEDCIIIIMIISI